MSNNISTNFQLFRRYALARHIGLASLLLLVLSPLTQAQPEKTGRSSASNVTTDDKVIIDTDIGMDIDDAFALALALDSPELNILGFSTASGDTLARAKIIDRMLGQSGHGDIPVAVGIPTSPPDKSWPAGIIGPQRLFGESGRYAGTSHPVAVDFILSKIRQYPGQITLITIGPLTNLGAAIDRDINTFRKVKRVVMMGGQIGAVTDLAGLNHDPQPEYNIFLDIPAAQKVFRSGVPIFVMPLDSTNNLTLDEVKRQRVFSTGTPLTDSLALLYLLWNQPTPILFDAMAVTYVLKPELCPVEPVHLTVEDDGVTRIVPGVPNAQICLRSNPDTFFNYFMARVTSTPEANAATKPLVSDTGAR